MENDLILYQSFITDIKTIIAAGRDSTYRAAMIMIWKTEAGSGNIMEYTVYGEGMPTVICRLNAGEKSIFRNIYTAAGGPEKMILLWGMAMEKLGQVKLASDILEKANIGLWAFELDEWSAPRMYADKAMLKLIGLDHPLAPEKIYDAWYDNIDENAFDLVSDAVEKMISGEHAEVQYPWHSPDGSVIIVRCGGVRNYDYKKRDTNWGNVT